VNFVRVSHPDALPASISGEIRWTPLAVFGGRPRQTALRWLRCPAADACWGHGRRIRNTDLSGVNPW